MAISVAKQNHQELLAELSGPFLRPKEECFQFSQRNSPWVFHIFWYVYPRVPSKMYIRHERKVKEQKRIRHDNMTRPLKNLGKQLRKINKINKMKNDE